MDAFGEEYKGARHPCKGGVQILIPGTSVELGKIECHRKLYNYLSLIV